MSQTASSVPTGSAQVPGPDAADQPGQLMRAEIHEQPTVWTRLLDEGRDAVTRAAATFRAAEPTQVVLLARGSSDNAAIYGQYLMQIGLHLPAALATPSVHTIYGSPVFPPGACVLAVSQSGASADLVQTLAAARQAGCLTLSMTNDPASPLAAGADAHIPLLAGPERSVAATKTYTSELLALWMFTRVVGNGQPDAPELAALGEQVLARADTACRALAERLAGVRRLLAVGRGYAYPSAREAALKLMETSYVMTQGLSAADAEHGPVAVLDPQTPLLAFASQGPGTASMASVVAAARAAGAPVEVIGDGTLTGDSLPALLPADVPPDLAPLLEILPAQLLALELAVLGGNDPDRPRGLSKVTSTI
jgi:glucosamine--fructose-6-phosphate aminotransferase (isomerizing)